MRVYIYNTWFNPHVFIQRTEHGDGDDVLPVQSRADQFPTRDRWAPSAVPVTLKTGHDYVDDTCML